MKRKSMKRRSSPQKVRAVKKWSATHWTPALQKRVSAKIRLLRHEGYPPKQAAAIAYRMIAKGKSARDCLGLHFHGGKEPGVVAQILSRSRRDVSGLAYLAPQGVMFDKTDARGVTHRFRVVRMGRQTVDLAHVGTYEGGAWHRGSGDVYPASARVLASMRRVASDRDHSRSRSSSSPLSVCNGCGKKRADVRTVVWALGGDPAIRLCSRCRSHEEKRATPRAAWASLRDYEAETLGGYQREHGWTPRGEETPAQRLRRIARSHREYARTAQSQAGGTGEAFFEGQGPGWDQRRPRRHGRKRRRS